MELAMDDRYRSFISSFIGSFIARLFARFGPLPGTLRGFEFFREKSVTLAKTANNIN
jgi:hypothetical protein